jgi:rhodanese-related sulfurtransferase
MKRLLMAMLTTVLAMSASLAQESDYPGRKTYPTVKTYNTEQLSKAFNDVTIVDVRTRYEFDTLHINNAVNVQLEDLDFSKRVKELSKEGKPIVFYCNGHSCYKSYKACIKSEDADIGNVFAYDSGVFDWARAQPDKATLLGKSPVDTARLISSDGLKKYLLKPKDFNARINPQAVILDIREPKQRGLIELYPYRQENISLDEKSKLDRFLNGIKGSGKTLLVYDEAGKQVRWFQYYLQEKGITDYFFMEGGVKAFFKEMRS